MYELKHTCQYQLSVRINFHDLSYKSQKNNYTKSRASAAEMCCCIYNTVKNIRLNKYGPTHSSSSCSETGKVETNGVKMKRNGNGRAGMSGKCLAM